MPEVGREAPRAGDLFGGSAALADALERAYYERFSGRLIALGATGVAIGLVDGLVTGVVTPAAPGPESLLLKSGRVGQGDWAKAVDSAADSGRLDEILVERSLVGGGELDVIRIAALYDGLFAVWLDAHEGWWTEPPGPGVDASLPYLPGLAPEVLLGEAARRYALLARRWGPPTQLAHCRPQVTAKAVQIGAGAGELLRHREILLCANGRRTPRDIAFVLGRGVYAVMVDIGHMEKRGLLQTAERTAPQQLPSVAPRRIEPGATSSGSVQLPEQLPQRSARHSAQDEGMTPYPKFDRAQAARLVRRLQGVGGFGVDVESSARGGAGDGVVED